MTLNTRQISAFLAIVHNGTLGRAAVALNTTQPALSRMIKGMEEDLGVQLFERHATGMIVTAYAKALLPHAELLQAESRNAVEELNELRGLSKGTVRVGAVSSVLSEALPLAIDRVLKRWPGLHFNIVEGVEDFLEEALLKRDIDLAIAVSLKETQEISLVSGSGWHDVTMLVASTHHHLRQNPDLTLRDLQKERWATPPRGTTPRKEMEQIFLSQGLEPPEIIVETRSIITIKALVANAGFLSCIPFPLYLVERGANIIDGLLVPGGTVKRQFSIFRRRNGILPLPAVKLLEELRHITTSEE
jgi:DNA-binding transcriptional LysR family regulator